MKTKIVSPNVGYVKRYRKIHEHWLYKFTQNNPRDRAGAWDDLIAMAIYEENGKDAMVEGEKIHCEKGQLFISRRSLATLWGWGLGKVDRFTRDLQADHMIDIKRHKSGSLITIVAYGLYQSEGSQTEHQTKPKRTKSKAINNKKQEPPTVEEEKNDSAPADETDPEPMRGTPEWYAWADRHDEEDDNG